MSLKNEVQAWLAYSRPDEPLSLKDLADLMGLEWPKSKSRIYTAVKALGDDVVVVQRGSRRGPLLMTAREDLRVAGVEE